MNPRSHFVPEKTQGYGTSAGCTATNVAASIYLSTFLANWFICLEYTLKPTTAWPFEAKK